MAVVMAASLAMLGLGREHLDPRGADMGMGYDAPCVCIRACVRSCAFVVSLAPLIVQLPG